MREWVVVAGTVTRDAGFGGEPSVLLQRFCSIVLLLVVVLVVFPA